MACLRIDRKVMSHIFPRASLATRTPAKKMAKRLVRMLSEMGTPWI